MQFLPFDIQDGLKFDLRLPNNIILDEYIQKCDFVFFLAYDVGGSKYLANHQDSKTMIDNNLSIMMNVFNVLEKYQKPFLFTSSQMSNMSYSVYGTLKNIGEYYTKTLNGINVKFWNVYGKEKFDEKSHVITDFIYKAIDGKIDMMTTRRREETISSC